MNSFLEVIMRYNFTVAITQSDNWYVAKCLEITNGGNYEDA